MVISPTLLFGHRPSKLVILTLLILGLIAPLPYVIVQPSKPEDVLGKLISITGVPTYPVSPGSKLFITAVLVSDPGSYVPGTEVIIKWLDGDSAVFPKAEIYPPAQSAAEISAENKADMKNSQQDATAAALNFLGYEIKEVVVVSGILKGSDSLNQLFPQDEIVSINSQLISSPEEIRSIIANHQVGDQISVVANRKGKSGSLEKVMVSIKLTPNETGKPALGIYVGSRYEFPFTVKFSIDKTGGPSGGLVFALGIIEKLTKEDLLKGRKVAGTGTLDSRGNIGSIGGITEKLIGAANGGATMFLVPTANCRDIKQVPSNLLVIPVASLSEAVTALQNPRPEELASCR